MSFGALSLATSLTLTGWLAPRNSPVSWPVQANQPTSLQRPNLLPSVVPSSSPDWVNRSKQNGGMAERPVVPRLPDTIPNVVDPSPNGIVGLNPGPEDDIGVGHLRPQNLSSLEGTDWINSPMLNAKWLRGVALPIYVGPGADHWGWLVNGWLIPNGYDPIAIGRDATFTMVQPQRGLYTFPVMEIREDGWFRFQYTPAGTAWAHTSQLNLGATEVAIETWSDWMVRTGRVKFRKHGASQPLRPAPNTSTPLRSLVGPNSLIEPLEIQADWIRVRVTQPANGCQPLPGSTTEEGWMRWLDDAAMPLIWFPTDGC